MSLKPKEIWALQEAAKVAIAQLAAFEIDCSGGRGKAPVRQTRQPQVTSAPAASKKAARKRQRKARAITRRAKK